MSRPMLASALVATVCAIAWVELTRPVEELVLEETSGPLVFIDAGPLLFFAATPGAPQPYLMVTDNNAAPRVDGGLVDGGDGGLVFFEARVPAVVMACSDPSAEGRMRCWVDPELVELVATREAVTMDADGGEL